MDRTELARAVDLHEKSHALFQWINAALKKKKIAFDEIHPSMSFVDAGLDWIRRHHDPLPREARPEPDELQEFVHLFASYLSTSFQVADRVRVSDGCSCSWCRHFVDARHAQPRNPGKKARQEARELKKVYLETLGATSEKAAGLIDDPDVSMACYGNELIRRSRFASQGEGILVLWREIAWDKGLRPEPKFKLSADAVLKAEERVRSRI